MSLHPFVDFEVRSAVDLPKHGLPVYATDPSTEILCIAYGTTKQNVKVWDFRSVKPPEDLFEIIEDAETIHAHNAAFEIWIWEHVAHKKLGWPVPKRSKWRCTAAKAAYNNRPRSLEGAGKALKVSKENEKLATGKMLIQKLCKLQRNGKFNEDPELLQQLFDYCKQDVVAEMSVDELLVDMPESEQRIWELDRLLNERGVPIDLKLCKNAFSMSERIVVEANEEINVLTGGEVKSTSQVARLLDWMQRRGANIASLRADVINEYLKYGGPPDVMRAMQLRQIGSPASVKKFKAALDVTSKDGRAREQLLYYGAGTGRWAGRGIQLQNLFRSVAQREVIDVVLSGDLQLLNALGNPMYLLQTSSRAMIKAPEGWTLNISDLSAIEARVLLWASRSRKGVEMFRKFDAKEGPEPYVVMAGKIYSEPPENIPKGPKRQVGKVAILGLGYGMGATKFQNAALTMGGVSLEMPMCEKVVGIYRKSHPEVVKFWGDLGKGFAAAVNGAKHHEVGPLVFSNVNGSVAMRLPSGRQLFYHNPKMMRNGNIQFVDQRGVTIQTWGGLLAENAVQAMSRDILADALLRCEAAGLNPILHVHDEIVNLTRLENAKAEAKMLHEILSTPPAWAKGCPIAAETHTSDRLTK